MQLIFSARCALLLATLFLLIITTFQSVTTNQVSHDKSQSSSNENTQQINHQIRQRRAIRSKPGFFWTLGSSIFQQFNETRHAISRIRNIINDQFVDERKPARTKVAPTLAPNTTTTAAPYRITRKEFNKIIMRNLRGLSRLYNLELNAALKQSEQNRADFNKQLRVSIKEQLS